MRAETQATAEAIEKSLDLLRQRMDHETAAFRLEEFNARVEDPTLWDDPDSAQKLMRERRRWWTRWSGTTPWRRSCRTAAS